MRRQKGELAAALPAQPPSLGWGLPARLCPCAWVPGVQCNTEGLGLVGGPLSDSLGFTLQGRQKPLCVQALTSSSTSHPTPPGPFKKKKKKSSSPGVGVRLWQVLGGRQCYVLRRGLELWGELGEGYNCP